MSLRPRYISALCTNEAISSPPPRTLLLQPAASRARTEQGGPEAYHRRAGGDGLLEVVRHAHRELAETELAAQSRATWSKAARARAGSPGGATVIRPSTRQPRSDNSLTIPGASAKAQPPRPASAGRVDLHKERRRCQRLAASSDRARRGGGRSPRPRRLLRRPASSPRNRARRPTLLRCTAPRKCQVTAPPTVVPLGEQLVGVVLAEVPKPAARPAATCSGPKPLVTATILTRSRVASGLGDPLGRAPRRPEHHASRRSASDKRAHGAVVTTSAWRPVSLRARQENQPGSHAVQLAPSPSRRRCRGPRAPGAPRREGRGPGGRPRSQRRPTARSGAVKRREVGRRRTRSTPGRCRPRRPRRCLFAPTASMAAAACSITPASRPRQPACTAADHSLAGSRDR